MFLIEKEICKEKSIKCSIKGKVSYAFFPSPRIKIKNVTVIDVINKQQTIADIENISAKLSIKNLLTKDKHKIKKIDINKFILKLKIDNFKNYKNIFTNKSNLIPTSFNEGKIIFSDQKVDVAIINNTNIKLNLENKNKLIKLKGNFLSDDLYIDFKSEEIDQKWISDIIIKMANLNFLTKANIYPSDQEKNALVGNVLVKKNKHRFTGLVNYKEGNFKINKSEFKNFYLDGAVSGKIEFLPYFDFDLDLDLKSINFTKIYNYFLNLEEKKKKDFFRVHNKINGNLSLSSDKIYSNIGLVKSLESRLEFNNGNILIEQFLINLGKLGAADIIGSINNDKKFTHLKYETNIFIDNQKKFLSRFGIYNKKKIHPNLFISGHFDLSNVKNGFYEISDDEKLSNEDINFVEKEFNDFMLENGYESLFNLSKFKEFIKSTSGEIN